METLQKKKGSVNKILNTYGIFLVLAVMCIVISILSDGRFLAYRNIVNVFRQVSITGILAIGATLILITGGIDLSVGSVLALAGVIAADMAHPESGFPLAAVFLTAVVIGLAAGAVNGSLVAYAGAPPFIVTLGMTTAARGMALLYAKGQPIVDFKKSFNFIGQGSLLGIPVPVWILILIIAISGVILHSTKLGRYIFAVGGNEDAARASGISVKHVKFFVYLYMGALCGIVGLILSARTNTGAPNAGAGYELDAIAAAVIGGTSISGGKGHIAGTVIGMLILGVLSNGLDILNISTYIQQIVKGIVIVLAVLMDIVQTKRN
ncbi:MULTISPECIES: ABC transporter permease [Clostridia]|uniref:ABC transporter permease n=1 Tax=Clostridia TaxID=186801 RepID=UPI00067E9C7E|nr:MULTISPECIES: ABC transporter permease [Clostridia]